MRYALLALLFLSACDGGPKGNAGPGYTGGAVENPRQALVGRWTVDADRLAEVGALEHMPEAQRPRAIEMARNIMNSMLFEFTEDHYAVTMTGRTYERTYTVKSTEGQVVTIEAKDGEAAETLTVEFTPKGLVLRAPGERPLPLKPRG